MPHRRELIIASAWLRSRQFPTVTLLCGLVAAAGALAADVTLLLPFVPRALPLSVVVLLLPAVALTTPLHSTFGGLERSFHRGVPDRALALMLAFGLAVAACVPAALAGGARFPWTTLLLLMALAVAAVVALGPAAWLPVSTAALALIYVDFAYNEPVQGALDDLGVPVLLAIVAAAGGMFVLRGPRVD